MAVAVTPGGVIFVADAGRSRVVRIEKGDCTELGEGLSRPTGLAVAGDRLFVVDPPAHAVVSFALGGGPELARFGTRGEGEGQLNFPTAITNRADGALLVVDALNFRVVTYSAAGKVLSTFGQGGDTPGDFGRPKGVTIDGHGRVYVSDAQYGVVLVFDAAGAWELAFGGSGREPKSLSLPAGLAVSGTTLFVADAYHHRVEFYELVEVSP
jgi:DNA-binding beta-propeller fold protein YncE